MLWVSTTVLPPGFHGPLVATVGDNEIHLTGVSAQISVRMPVELIFHLTQLPGVWLVLVSTDGAISAAEAVPFRDHGVAEVLDLFPQDRRPIAPAMRSKLASATTLDALDDSIFLCASATTNGGPSSQAMNPALPAFWHQACQGLRSLVENSAFSNGRSPSHPAGVFLPGFDARRFVDDNPRSHRIRLALATLERIDFGSSHVRAGMLDTSRLVEIIWLDEVLETSGAEIWGWDPASRRIGLPTHLDPALDAMHLAVGLYYAHRSFAGPSLISMLADSVLEPPKQIGGIPRPAAAAILADIVGEAGQAWEIMLMVALQCGPSAVRWTGQFGSTDDSDGESPLAPLPFSLEEGVADHASHFLKFCEACRYDWHDVRRRIAIPIPPRQPRPLFRTA